MNSNVLSYLKCGNRIKADKYGYCGWENSARNDLVLMVLKLVYLVAQDKVMATLNVLYIYKQHAHSFFLLFLFFPVSCY